MLNYIKLDPVWKYAITHSVGYSIPLKIRKLTKEWDVITQHYRLGPSGLLIEKHYAWDGPSGPTFDTENAMRASLIHDALYQAIRDRFLSLKDRKTADRIFLSILKDDGMSFVRRWLWYRAVRLYGEKELK